jgi:heat shock protein HslJ
MKWNDRIPAAILALALAACAPSGRSATPGGAGVEQSPSPLGQLPASFAGEIPCADCPGILYRLNLFPDYTFRTSMTYEERNATFYDSGTWALSSDQRTLELKGKGAKLSLLRVVDPRTLRMLDAEGHEIESGLNYSLERTEHFERIDPRPSAAPLEGTEWKLIALDEELVSVGAEERAPSLRLDPSDHRATGSGGCNRFSASYALHGDSLSFGPIVSTKMACRMGMDTERAYFAALAEVRRWRVAGRQLELYDAGGKRLARFEAGAAGR